MKKSLIAVLAAASLLFAVGAAAEDSVALPGTIEAQEIAAGVQETPAMETAEEVQPEEAEEAGAEEIEAINVDVLVGGEVPAEVTGEVTADSGLELTTEYRWFVNKYSRTYGKTVTYYDNVYAYNHGDYYLTPFASDVPEEYFVVDESGAYAVAPIVLDITDAMRTRLYGADVGETYMLYGQYCERVNAKYGRIGFSGIHEGIDFVNAEGCSLYAILGGEVTRAGDENGTVAVYNEEYDCTVLYLHCRKIGVKIGDKIEAGTFIGVEGDKKSGSPYTHVEFRYGRRKSSNAYRNTTLESDCPYPVMQEALGVVESGRQPVTAAAVLEAKRMREEAEAALRALEEAAEKEAEQEPEIELIDTLPEAGAGYGFGEEAAAEAETVVPEATLPPA